MPGHQPLHREVGVSTGSTGTRMERVFKIGFIPVANCLTSYTMFNLVKQLE